MTLGKRKKYLGAVILVVLTVCGFFLRREADRRAVEARLAMERTKAIENRKIAIQNGLRGLLREVPLPKGVQIVKRGSSSLLPDTPTDQTTVVVIRKPFPTPAELEAELPKPNLVVDLETPYGGDIHTPAGWVNAPQIMRRYIWYEDPNRTDYESRIGCIGYIELCVRAGCRDYGNRLDEMQIIKVATCSNPSKSGGSHYGEQSVGRSAGGYSSISNYEPKWESDPLPRKISVHWSIERGSLSWK
jgi:hypothetical protein